MTAAEPRLPESPAGAAAAPLLSVRNIEKSLPGVLASLEIHDLSAERIVGTLSAGNRQHVEIRRALSQDARIAVVDGKLKPGATSVEAGKLTVVNGSEILLGPPFILTKANVKDFDF
jgi:hypothetical protein